uniref:Uncharacterized protein n=1 Tax=Amazona collaria TaxID=241587 RepID=A0A8B9FBA2_9PSIT
MEPYLAPLISEDQIAMDKLLQKYDCAPSPAWKEWAQKFWKDEDEVVERIEQCRALYKLKVGKGKNVMCAVLGACLSCAQEEAKNAPAPNLTSDVKYAALKSENEVLKSSLAFHKETGEKLEARNDQLESENKNLEAQNVHLVSQVDQLKRENKALGTQVDRLVNQNSQTEEFWSDRDDSDKGETQIPWSPTELMKLREKYSRRMGESETEYLWRISLQGGDMVMLNEEEAGGFWGPGVFLTTTPGDHYYSLTARVAYWAGESDPQERGEPLSIQTTSYFDLAEAVQKAACIQAMYNRDDLRKSPMSATIDPDRLNPLIRGFPDCLKMFVVNIQKRIQDHDHRRGRRAYTLTWNEFVQEIDQYGRKMGWVDSSREKPSNHTRRVRQVHTRNSNPDQNWTENPKSHCFSTHNSKFDGKFRSKKERNRLWCKALDLGAPRHILHGISTEDLRTLVRILSERNNSVGENRLGKEFPSREESVPSVPESDLIDLSEP